MAEKWTGRTFGLILAVVLFVGALACAPAARADDAETLRMIPGRWTCTDEVQEDGEEEIRTADIAFLTFGEDGTLSMRCNDRNGEYAWTCEGTWSSELVTDGMDRLTLRFTSTDNPMRAGSEYSVECVYNIYSESWVENDTEIIYLILEDGICSDTSPFEELTGYDGAAIHRENGPNMRVVNCSNYVSLREKPSKSSARLAKVPLGALVLAFPEAGEENGFITCIYRDEYGFILSEYLEPAE